MNNEEQTVSAEWFIDYHLPPELIAQQAIEPRDLARLLVLDADGTSLHHQTVRDLPSWLAPGDLLVFNDTRVIPARLLGTREGTGGAFEMLFVRPAPIESSEASGNVPGNGLWEVMAKTGGKPGPGTRFFAESPMGDARLPLVLVGRTERRRWLVRPEMEGDFADLLNCFGHLPLPPYIRSGREEPGDRERYQTLWAGPPGSVAAPTAGLHFTESLLGRIVDLGIDIARVTLHVGPGTFQTIQADPANHEVEPEWGEVSQVAAQKIAACMNRKGRVIAVGTTTTRVLESAARIWEKASGTRASQPLPQAWKGEADLTIRPGHRFQVVDGLMTNFHLPRSGLLLLAGALAGCERLAKTYDDAIRKGYRFYSYGDAMLILPKKQGL